MCLRRSMFPCGRFLVTCACPQPLLLSASPRFLSSRLFRCSSFFLAPIARLPFSSVFLLLVPPCVSHLLSFVLCWFGLCRFALSCRWFVIGLQLFCPCFGLGEEIVLAATYASFWWLGKKALLLLLLDSSCRLYCSICFRH